MSDLHVTDGLQLLLSFRFLLLEILHQVLDVGADLSKVQVQVLVNTHTDTKHTLNTASSHKNSSVSLCLLTHVGVELVVLRRQDDLPQVLADSRDARQVDPVVVKTQQLVDHGLVGPLQYRTTQK